MRISMPTRRSQWKNQCLFLAIDGQACRRHGFTLPIVIIFQHENKRLPIECANESGEDPKIINISKNSSLSEREIVL
jgi:hypothetical protein